MFVSGLIVLIFIAICHSNGLPDGQSRPRRVIGGDKFEKGKYPFLVSLWFSGKNDFSTPDLPHMCGGSLVGKQWVLTAGHCFDEVFLAGVENASLWTVYLGMHAQKDAKDHAQRHHIEEIFPFPKFNTTEMYGDVALIKLDKPATLSSTVDLINMNGDPGCPVADEDVVVMGWGQTHNDEIYGPSSDVPHEATLEVVKIKDCQDTYSTPNMTEYYGVSPRIDRVGSLCAGKPEGGVDGCYGDSGGPLLATCGGNSRVVVGISSHGYGCARKGYPGVYTRVSGFKQWIDSTMKNNC